MSNNGENLIDMEVELLDYDTAQEYWIPLNMSLQQFTQDNNFLSRVKEGLLNIMNAIEARGEQSSIERNRDYFVVYRLNWEEIDAGQPYNIAEVLERGFNVRGKALIDLWVKNKYNF